MSPRLRISLVLAVLFAFGLAFPVFAGGWAVITLDELPSNVVAGQPLTIGFTVLQHGKEPMRGLSPTITASLSKDMELVIPATEQGKPGYYTATITFPKEGEWRWSIQAFSMDQAMPAMSVAAPKASAASPGAAASEPMLPALSPVMAGSTLALGLGLVAAVLGFRRRSRPLMALTGFCLLLGVILLLTAGGTASEVEAQTKYEAKKDPATSRVEHGRQLFIAKGCITCHANSRAGRPSEYLTIQMGAPDLSNFSASREVLFIRLKDPSAAKSDTKMPNLELTEAEIEALIDFINSK